MLADTWSPSATFSPSPGVTTVVLVELTSSLPFHLTAGSLPWSPVILMPCSASEDEAEEPSLDELSLLPQATSEVARASGSRSIGRRRRRRDTGSTFTVGCWGSAVTLAAEPEGFLIGGDRRW